MRPPTHRSSAPRRLGTLTGDVRHGPSAYHIRFMFALRSGKRGRPSGADCESRRTGSRLAEQPGSSAVTCPLMSRSRRIRNRFVAKALYGLSKRSVWWLRLGIPLERIRPGHPEQKRRHERMHLTLKTEATKPAAANVLKQQARFDTFVDRYNRERPHQALGIGPGRRLHAVAASLSRPRRSRLSAARLGGNGDQPQPDLLRKPKGESHPGLRRPASGRASGERAHLARHLHALRFGILR